MPPKIVKAMPMLSDNDLNNCWPCAVAKMIWRFLVIIEDTFVQIPIEWGAHGIENDHVNSQDAFKNGWL